MSGKLFYCHTCEREFASWKDLKDHYRSKEHKDRSNMGNPESLAEKFAKHFNELNDGSKKV